MFEQSLLESAAVVRSRRSLTTSVSALAQLALLGIAILLPMVFRQTLPLNQLHPVPPVLWNEPPQPRPEPTPPSSANATGPVIVMRNVFPTTLIKPSENLRGEPALPVPVGTQSTLNLDLPLSSVGETGHIQGPSRPLIVSRLSEGSIIRRVKPAYPALARAAGVQGQVLLEAIISRTGQIENLRVVSGHPMLVPAAKEAVSQWQFRPYILNGTPIEVVTQITVDFKLSRE